MVRISPSHFRALMNRASRADAPVRHGKWKSKLPSVDTLPAVEVHADGVTIVMPIRTWSEKNMHDGHWFKHERNKKQREAVRMYLLKHRQHIPPAPVDVTLTRFATRKLDAGDNLPMSMWCARDSIARFLGVDDGDESKVTFAYEQKPGWRDYAIAVKIVARKAAT